MNTIFDDKLSLMIKNRIDQQIKAQDDYMQSFELMYLISGCLIHGFVSADK